MECSPDLKSTLMGSSAAISEKGEETGIKAGASEAHRSAAGQPEDGTP